MMVGNIAVRPLLLAAGVYASLATGAGAPIVCDLLSCHIEWWRAGISTALVALAVLVATPLRAPVRLALLGVAALALLPLLHVALSVSSYPDYVLGNVYEFALGSALAIVFIDALFHRYDRLLAFKTLVGVFACVLLLAVLTKAVDGTLLYRYHGRFLINGPITFGWLMGMGCLFAISVNAMTGKPLWLLAAVVFFLGVVWTASKGPILACLVAICYIVLLSRNRSPKRLLLFAAIVGTGLLLASSLVGDQGNFSRLNVIEQAATAGAEGSLQIRRSALALTLQMTGEHPLFGIGAGNFADHTRLPMAYPHNVYLEVFSEYGMPAGMLLLSMLWLSLVRADPAVRAMIVFLAVALCFSGNYAYLRYLMPFVYLATLYSMIRPPRTRMRRHRPRLRAH